MNKLLLLQRSINMMVLVVVGMFLVARLLDANTAWLLTVLIAALILETEAQEQ